VCVRSCVLLRRRAREPRRSSATRTPPSGRRTPSRSRVATEYFAVEPGGERESEAQQVRWMGHPPINSAPAPWGHQSPGPSWSPAAPSPALRVTPPFPYAASRGPCPPSPGAGAGGVGAGPPTQVWAEEPGRQPTPAAQQAPPQQRRRWRRRQWRRRGTAEQRGGLRGAGHARPPAWGRRGACRGVAVGAGSQRCVHPPTHPPTRPTRRGVGHTTPSARARREGRATSRPVLLHCRRPHPTNHCSHLVSPPPLPPLQRPALLL
jgi:hypothetical protein